jgi:hypothetical protein
MSNQQCVICRGPLTGGLDTYDSILSRSASRAGWNGAIPSYNCDAATVQFGADGKTLVSFPVATTCRRRETIGDGHHPLCRFALFAWREVRR